MTTCASLSSFSLVCVVYISNTDNRFDKMRNMYVRVIALPHRGRDFLHASVRGLYKYVMEAITTPYKVPTATPTNDDNDDDEHVSTDTPSTSPARNKNNNNNTKDESTDALRNNNVDNDDDDEISREDLTYRERLGTYAYNVYTFVVVLCSFGVTRD